MTRIGGRGSPDTAKIFISYRRRAAAGHAGRLYDDRVDHFAQWPHVKNLVPHQSVYNFGRMQEVWRDK